MSVNIITSVKIAPEQKQFLESKSINFSKFVRNKIDEEMRVQVIHSYEQKR